MKRVKNILLAIVLIIANACNSEQAPLSNRYPLTCSIQSRSENTPLSLPIGSQILLNAQGGLDIQNEIFTYNGSTWENENDYQWTNPEEEGHIIALYPTYPNNEYSLTNLYSTEELADVLIAQKTYEGKENITLQFKHLFSSLTIHIEETLLESIKDIQLTIPVKVNHISPQEGTFSIIEETHIVTQENHGEKTHFFIIPPVEACVLTLTLIMQDNTIHIHELNPHTFLSGVQYECKVLKADQRPGIRNAEQLIAFNQLINGSYKENKYTLADFGEEINGEMVYRLLADITLTEEECNKLEPMGIYTSYPFTGTFDGEGHTIANLKFKAYKGCGGFFGKIEENATIQNLNIENARGPIEKSDSEPRIGFIVGQCNGKIFNCHVTNSYLLETEANYSGGIAGSSNNKIINCSVKNSTLAPTATSLGTIAGYLYKGEITNCYSSNNTISGKSTYNGGICGFAQNGTITNCYVYTNKNVNGQFIDYASSTTLTNCYYDISKSTLALIKTSKSCTTSPNYKYNNTSFTINNTPIYLLLNQWIGNDSTYLQWKTGTTIPAVFTTQ